MPARRLAAVVVEHHGRGRLLPDPDGQAGDALLEQGLQGLRAALPGTRVLRTRHASQEEGLADQVPQVRAALRRAAGALLGWQLHLRAGGPRQVLVVASC